MHRDPLETAAADLRVAITNYRNTRTFLENALDVALATRNLAIAKALNAGMKQIDVARVVGVGREQIRQISKAQREKATQS
jgi:hypothetical protein